MPRKSLPTARSTPKHVPLPTRSNTSIKRSTRQSSGTPTRRKRRRSAESDEQPDADVEDEKPAAVAGKSVEMDPEKELEAWQDFVTDHYEMVEQLPLELHRNFRLLRELDDGCAAHTAKLQAVIRSYIARRFAFMSAEVAEPVEESMEVDQDHPPSPPLPSETLPNGEGDTTHHHAPEDMGIPEPDGEGGLVLPPEPPDTVTDEHREGRLAFPEESEKLEQVEDVDGPNGNTVNGHQVKSHVAEDVEMAETPVKASSLLPEIGKLAREIVRNGEEKVALAIGAYNAIDRHIRALDSALSAHEASILLGLRPDTNPSAMVEDPAMIDANVQEVAQEDETVTIGMGGGGRRKRKGKKGQKEEPIEALQPAPATIIPPEFEIDPNEPRYCYCNQVSYGQMIGCENEECPLEWFHLACAGLTVPPTGKWWCNICKPKAGGGQGQTGVAGGPKKGKKR